MKFNNMNEFYSKLIEIVTRDSDNMEMRDSVGAGELLTVKSLDGKLIYATLNEEETYKELGVEFSNSGLLVLDEDTGLLRSIEHSEIGNHDSSKVVCIPEIELFILAEDHSKYKIMFAGFHVVNTADITVDVYDVYMDVNYGESSIKVYF